MFVRFLSYSVSFVSHANTNVYYGKLMSEKCIKEYYIATLHHIHNIHCQSLKPLSSLMNQTLNIQKTYYKRSLLTKQCDNRVNLMWATPVVTYPDCSQYRACCYSIVATRSVVEK